MPATTSTGSFRIGFRRGWIEWQKDLPKLAAWAKAQDFAAIDVGQLPRAELEAIKKAGLDIGTIDLSWGELASVDAGKRKAAAQKNAEYINSVADLCKNFFTVIIPEQHDRKRSENFDFAIDGYGQLCTAIAKQGCHIAIEGYPGGAPHLSSLACTPADYRAVLKALPANAGINFDPSHLVRMGIDPVRFLKEFAPRVRHVHGKDTEIFDEEIYEHGWTQNPTFAKGHGFGQHYWRYTIPGHGIVRWIRCMELLKEAGFKGIVSIELEDERYNPGGEAGEKAGLIASRNYLSTV